MTEPDRNLNLLIGVSVGLSAAVTATVIVAVAVGCYLQTKKKNNKVRPMDPESKR